MEKGGDTFDFSGQPAGDSLGTMLMKFTFCKSHFEIVYKRSLHFGTHMHEGLPND